MMNLIIGLGPPAVGVVVSRMTDGALFGCAAFAFALVALGYARRS